MVEVIGEEISGKASGKKLEEVKNIRVAQKMSISDLLNS